MSKEIIENQTDYSKLYKLLFKDSFIEVQNEKFGGWDEVFIDLSKDKFIKRCKKLNVQFTPTTKKGKK
jgi:hypothetical protein